MAAGPTGKSRLIKVVAIDPGFPYYGSFKTKLSGKITGKDENILHQLPVVWLYPELRSQLNLDLGDKLKIGEANFRVTDFILDEAGLSFQPAELAPKAFISTKFLEQTKLLSQGNTAFYNHLLQAAQSHLPQ